MPQPPRNEGMSPAMGTEPAAILSALRDPETKIAAMLCSCVLKKLEYWYDTPLTYEQLTAALLSAGIDLVVTPTWTRAQSLGQVSDLLDRHLGHGTRIITDHHEAKQWLRREHPELEEHFSFYDSLQTCFGNFYREHYPAWKLLNITCDDVNGLEAADTGIVDWFLNARGCYELLEKTVGCPGGFEGVQPEEIAPFGEDRRYSGLLRGHGKKRREDLETIRFEEDGTTFTAALCRGTAQAEKALAEMGSFDVIRILEI